METICQALVSIPDDDCEGAREYPVSMMEMIRQKRPPKVYIREWLTFRDVTQERLAERMDIAKGTLSKLVNGKMDWTPAYLAHAAEALSIDFHDLFRDPKRVTPHDLLRQAILEVPDDRADDVINVIRALTKKAS